MASCLIGLGSNLGDRAATLHQAVARLAALSDTRLISQSRFLATLPVGGPAGQGEFLNAAALLETTLAPPVLLAGMLQIEHELGRVRAEPWGARTIDLDLLLYDDVQIRSASLTIPHPRLAFRRFVLASAVEIAGEMRHPEIGWTIWRLWAHLNSAFNYVALAGGDSAQRQKIVERATREGDVEPIYAATFSSAGLRILPTNNFSPVQVSQFFIQAELALKKNSRPQLDPQLAAPQQPQFALSDFWLEEFTQQLIVALTESQREQLLERMQNDRSEILTPKLLVRLLEPVDAAAPSATDFEGPQLRLAAGDADMAVREVTAAIAAMR